MESRSKPQSRPSRPETSALFVRIPVAEARKLDRAAFELTARKQDLVAGLVARYVDPSSPAGLQALAELRPGGDAPARDRAPADDARRVTLETADDSLAVGRHSFATSDRSEVLTLEQAADLLQVSEEAVEALAGDGELPGRKIGADWRFSRSAVLAWLAGGSEAEPAPRPAGSQTA